MMTQPVPQPVFESLPVGTSSPPSADADLIRGFTDNEIMGFLEEFEILAATHPYRFVGEDSAEFTTPPYKFVGEDSGVSNASGKMVGYPHGVAPPSWADVTSLIREASMPNTGTTSPLLAAQPRRGESMGAHGQESSSSSGVRPGSTPPMKRKRKQLQTGDNSISISMECDSLLVPSFFLSQHLMRACTHARTNLYEIILFGI